MHSYDANGNLATKTEGSDTWACTWNAENQLTKVQKNGAEVARFSYDPLGRRVEKDAGGVTTTWTYDSAAILRETSPSATYKHIQGPHIDEPLAREDSSGIRTYYHADGLGSIVKMTDATGAVVLTRQYDTWGNLEVGADQLGYSFTGREWDLETGLYYYRARYYDAKVGRFFSEDPIRFRAGVNFYAYVENDPANENDPLGLHGRGRTPWRQPPTLPTTDPTGAPWDIPEQAIEAQQRDFPGFGDPYGGGFRHCMSACLLERRYGYQGDVAVNWYDLLHENSSSKPSTDSESDMAAEQHGLACGRKSQETAGTCEQACLEIYQPTWRWQGGGSTAHP